LSFVSLRWSKITDKLAIKCQKILLGSISAQVRFYDTVLNVSKIQCIL